jgi:hypothetical protein
MPRAIGYSAGIINHFFRGKMEIGLPADGIYAIVDHSLLEANSKFTGGFKKVKLKLTNRTDSIIESGTGTVHPQNLDATGTVAAVAKFRRNTCYEPTKLAGELGALVAQGQTQAAVLAQCRSSAEEIVVSDFITLDTTLAKDQSKELTFNFNTNRIPINATDLYLQVVYRGQLGAEDDAVVVTTKDVSEPSFITLENALDCRSIGDTATNPPTYADICNEPTATPDTFELAFKDPQQGGQYIVPVSLKQRQLARIVGLFDQASPYVWVKQSNIVKRFGTATYPISVTNQFDTDPQAPIDKMYKGRGAALTAIGNTHWWHNGIILSDIKCLGLPAGADCVDSEPEKRIIKYEPYGGSYPLTLQPVTINF